MTKQSRFEQNKLGGFAALLALTLTLFAVTACSAGNTNPERPSTSAPGGTSTVTEGGTEADHAEIINVIRKSIAAMARVDGKSFDSMQCRAYRPAPGSPDSFSGILDKGMQQGVRLVHINRIKITGNSATVAYTLQYKTLDDVSKVDGTFVREGGKWLSC